MAMIIGITHSSFLPKDSTIPIEGSTIHVTEPIDPKRGTGKSAEHFFLTKAKLADLSFTPDVGMEVEVLFNRYGRVSSLKLLDNPNISYEID